MRTYTHKLYDIQGNYIRVLSDNVIFPNFKLEGSINSGISTYSFTIDTQYDSPLQSNEYLLIVNEFSPNNKEGFIAFAGTLDSIGGKLGDRENTLTYTFGGLHRLLNKIIYPMVPFTNQKVKDLIQSCVDSFNTKYPIVGMTLGGDLIKNLITDETIITQTSTNAMTALQYISEIIKLSGGWFYIKPNGELIGGQKSLVADHRLMIHKEIMGIDIERTNIIDVVNRINIGGIWYEDLTSVGLYGPREKGDTLSTTDITTIQNYAAKYLSENAYGRREITLDVILDDYSNIYPGQTIAIRNTRLDNVNNLQIQKTSYDGYNMTLYLEKYISLPQLIVQ